MYFRFDTSQVINLIDYLQIPQCISFNGCKTSAIEAICISLHRLSSHCRFIDLSMIYDLRPQVLSQIFAGMMVLLFRKYGNLVRSFEHSWTVSRTSLDEYASKVSSTGCPLENVVGFLDGTHVPVARPSRDQRQWYCGHHRQHCFKSTAIQYPNGLMWAFGPFDGSTHDSTAA